MRYFLVLVILLVGVTASAKKVIYRKKQNINFDGASVDGVVRNPDGAYLMQRRGMKFLPMYKVKNKFDDEIKQSVDYLR